KKAAKATAPTGPISRVPTTVAMEFAASWRPFRKSNASATTINPTSSGSAMWYIQPLLGMIDDDAVDLVGDVFERVHHTLEILEHLARDGELKRVAAGRLECALEARRVDFVGFALQRHHPSCQLMQAVAVAGDVAKQGNGLGGDRRRLGNQCDDPLHFGSKLMKFIEID